MSFINKSILFILLFSYSYVFCIDEITPGLPFITNYPFEEYDASPQNWGIVQAENGIMYFANGSGVLEFDGTNWRLIELPNKTIVRSLDISQQDVIYIGGYEEFGYLRSNKTGTFEYVSLLHKLPENANYFQDVWTTKIIDDKVFFQTYNSIIFIIDCRVKKIFT